MCEEFDHENRIYTLEGSIKVLKERIEKLENKINQFASNSNLVTIAKLEKEISELKSDLKHCVEWIDGNGDEIIENIQKISELQKYNKTFRRFINRICLEQVQTDNNRIKDISELKMCDMETAKSLMYLDSKIEDIKSVLKDFFEAFDKRWGSDYRKQLDGEWLNPHLQCNGECYNCEDNIPSHGSVPNQCKRQLEDGKKRKDDDVRVKTQGGQITPSDSKPSEPSELEYNLEQIMHPFPDEYGLNKVREYIRKFYNGYILIEKSDSKSSELDNDVVSDEEYKTFNEGFDGGYEEGKKDQKQRDISEFLDDLNDLPYSNVLEREINKLKEKWQKKRDKT